MKGMGLAGWVNSSYGMYPPPHMACILLLIWHIRRWCRWSGWAWRALCCRPPVQCMCVCVCARRRQLGTRINSSNTKFTQLTSAEMTHDLEAIESTTRRILTLLNLQYQIYSTNLSRGDPRFGSDRVNEVRVARLLVPPVTILYQLVSY